MASLTRIFGRRLSLVKNTNISRVFICTSSRCLASADTVTHTGQVFEKDDYKRVRFTNREKTVNEQFAIDLIDEEPPIEVNSHVVWCDGGRYLPKKTVARGSKGNGRYKMHTSYENCTEQLQYFVPVKRATGNAALGHPKVYINLDQDGPHACGYCGLRYVMKAGAH